MSTHNAARCTCAWLCASVVRVRLRLHVHHLLNVPFNTCALVMACEHTSCSMVTETQLSNSQEGGSTEDLVARALSRIDLAETQAAADNSALTFKPKTPRTHSPLAPLTTSIAVPMHDEPSHPKPRAVRAHSVPMHLGDPSNVSDPAAASQPVRFKHYFAV